MNNKQNDKKISNAVIRRLPRYFRYLRELIRNDIMRISSRELSEKMNITASQIRQDLNCFGGFGQQGYGYNVKFLYSEISHILGVDNGISAVIIGIGNMGKALVNNPLFEKRGIKVMGLFDTDPNVIGKTYGDLTVMDANNVSAYITKTILILLFSLFPRLPLRIHLIVFPNPAFAEYGISPMQKSNVPATRTSKLRTYTLATRSWHSAMKLHRAKKTFNNRSQGI